MSTSGWRVQRTTKMQKKHVYMIDGSNFCTLEGFYDEISRVLLPGVAWGHNLDAFNDILRGGFGTPNEGFVLEWKNSALSHERLGYDETVRQLERRLERCDPSNVPQVQADLEAAKRHEGPRVFDWLVGIIEIRGGDGRERADGVELVLA